MKTIVKNGLKYQVTDALYETLNKKDITEWINPFSGINNPNLGLQNNQNNQDNNQNNNQDNNNQNDDQNLFSINSVDDKKMDKPEDISNISSEMVFNTIKNKILENLNNTIKSNNFIQKVLYNEVSRQNKNKSAYQKELDEKYNQIIQLVKEMFENSENTHFQQQFVEIFNEIKNQAKTKNELVSTMFNKTLEMLGNSLQSRLQKVLNLNNYSNAVNVSMQFSVNLVKCMNGVQDTNDNTDDDKESFNNLKDFINYLKIYYVDIKGNKTDITKSIIIPENAQMFFTKQKDIITLDLNKISKEGDSGQILKNFDEFSQENYDKIYNSKNSYGNDYLEANNDKKYIEEHGKGILKGFISSSYSKIKEVLDKAKIDIEDDSKYVCEFFADPNLTKLLDTIEMTIQEANNEVLQNLDTNVLVDFGYDLEIKSVNESLREMIKGNSLSKSQSFSKDYNVLIQQINEKNKNFVQQIKINHVDKINPDKLFGTVKEWYDNKSNPNEDIHNTATDEFLIKNIFESKDDNKLTDFNNKFKIFNIFKVNYFSFDRLLEREFYEILKNNSFEKATDNDFGIEGKNSNKLKTKDNLFDLTNSSEKNQLIQSYMKFMSSFFGIKPREKNDNLFNSYQKTFIYYLIYRSMNHFLNKDWERLEPNEREAIKNEFNKDNQDDDDYQKFYEIMNREPELNDIELYESMYRKYLSAKNLIPQVLEGLKSGLKQKGAFMEKTFGKVSFGDINITGINFGKTNLFDWFNNDDDMYNKILKLDALKNSFLKYALAYTFLTQSYDKNQKGKNILEEIIPQDESERFSFEKIGQVFLNIDITTNISTRTVYTALVESKEFADSFRAVDPLFTNEGGQSVTYVPVAKKSGNVFCVLRIKRLLGLWRE